MKKYLIGLCAAAIIFTAALSNRLLTGPESLEQIIKPCFNQFQWSQLNLSEIDKVSVTSFTFGVSSVDHVGDAQIRCALAKLDLPKSAFDEMKQIGAGEVQGKQTRFVAQWYTQLICRKKWLACDPIKNPRNSWRTSELTFLEVKAAK